MNLEEMKRRKKELGYSNERIAELSGVPLSTVQKIFAGVTQQPRYDTLAALERTLCESVESFRVEEAVFQYIAKNQGEYTIEDYEKLPEDMRFELIDGVLYYISAPLLVHQALVALLHQELKDYIRKKQGDCIAMLSPADIHLRRDDNKTMVQPDIFVVCDRGKFRRHRIEGAPDLIIEILSPSTKKKDCVIKLNKYIEAGVREYWLVDPETQKVMVYILEEDVIPKIYTFTDRIPVAVFGGKCVIDMNQFKQELQFFYDLEEDDE